MREQPLSSPATDLHDEECRGEKRERSKLCPLALVCLAVPSRMFHWKLPTKPYCEVSDFGNICVAREGP